MTGTWKPLPNLDKYCFACGTENNFGLQMQFSSNETQVKSVLTLPDHTRGWCNLVHGGILATILDEIMSWTAIYLTRHFILTRNIEISFKKPVFIGTPLTATGSIIARDGKKALLGAQIHDDSGTLCCTAEAGFVLYTQAEFARMNIIPHDFLEEMSANFTGE
ncbi:MAG: PaaI family thioesterase [Deltaproteobacteria bacterium]|nr:PaaI family thioesterase [Deltaproteobacteria bacterium]